MNSEDIDNLLKELDSSQKSIFLLTYGHQPTVMAREAYEFQSSDVKNSRLLRDANEIFHRVFQALKELETNSEECFSLSGISHWISCKDRNNEIQRIRIDRVRHEPRSILIRSDANFAALRSRRTAWSFRL